MYKLIMNPYKQIDIYNGRLTLGVNDLKGPVAPPFSPNDIADLSRWYDFSDQSTITLSTADYITSIDDKTTGSTHFLAQNTAVNQPHLIQNAINGLSAGRFVYDGSNYDLMTDNPALPDYNINCTIFTVFHTLQQNAETYNALISLDSSQDGGARRFFVHAPWKNDNYYWDMGTEQNDRCYIGTSTPYDVAMLTSFKDNANSINTMRLNGGTATANSSGFTAARTSDLWVGKKVTDTYMAEFVIYERRITDAEIYKVEGYLAWKWGLQGTLPASHPYKNNPPS